MIKPEIVHARNWFVLHYKIVCKKKCPNKLLDVRRELGLDHTESYEDVHGRIVYIYSMYDKRDICGFNTIPCMYALDQRTGILFLETNKSKKKMIEHIKSKVPDDIIPIIKSYLGKGYYL
tara:strand:- start:59 stop:418 length:360 start_codon:yes stop_codon:yes gene_type:complete